MTTVDKSQHRHAIALMVGAATLWSMAGVVTRQLSLELQVHGRFEITFWRSFFAAVFIAGYLLLVRRQGLQPVVASGRAGLISGAMWATMFSAFMLALTLTTTANTLLVMSVSPLLTALLARLVLHTPVPGRTRVAIVVATVGMVWMFARGDGGLPSGSHLLGMAIALAVPLASAVNLVTLQKVRAQADLVPAILIGGALSAGLMLVAIFAGGGTPWRAGGRDILLLAVLGFFQLGLPCMMMIRATRHLSAPEVALLALLEVLLGPIWAWLGADEVPSAATLAGGALVLMALVANELAGLNRRQIVTARQAAP